MTVKLRMADQTKIRVRSAAGIKALLVSKVTTRAALKSCISESLGIPLPFEILSGHPPAIVQDGPMHPQSGEVYTVDAVQQLDHTAPALQEAEPPLSAPAEDAPAEDLYEVEDEALSAALAMSLMADPESLTAAAAPESPPPAVRQTEPAHSSHVADSGAAAPVSDDCCCICLDDAQDPVMAIGADSDRHVDRIAITDPMWTDPTNTCGHIFCRKCLCRWASHKKVCPMCKRDFVHLKSTAPGSVVEPITPEPTLTDVLDPCRNITSTAFAVAGFALLAHIVCFG